MNIAIIQGRAVGDPQIEHSDKGRMYSRFRVACDRPYKGKDVPRGSDYFTVVCFNKWAEFAFNHIAKGALITVLGRLEQSEYVDGMGSKREKVSIIVKQITVHEWLRKHRELTALDENFDNLVPREITQSLIKQIDIDDEDIPDDLLTGKERYVDD